MFNVQKVVSKFALQMPVNYLHLKRLERSHKVFEKIIRCNFKLFENNMNANTNKCYFLLTNNESFIVKIGQSKTPKTKCVKLLEIKF